MTPQELTEATVAYLIATAPFLLLFFALSSADRLIDLIYRAIGDRRYV